MASGTINVNYWEDRAAILTEPSSVNALMDYAPGVYQFNITNSTVFPCSYGILEIIISHAYGIARVSRVLSTEAMVWQRSWSVANKTWYESTWRPLTDYASDTGWVDLTLKSGFKNFSDSTDNKPQYRKIGDVVYLRGAISPTAAISSTSQQTFTTLPSGTHPTKTQYFICQGSDMNRWLLSVAANGDVGFGRYGTTTASTSVPTSAWLAFNGVSFPIE